MSQNIHILVGTPCYSGLIHQDYVKSVIEFQNAKLPLTYMHIGNESLITRARNTIISYFYHNKDNFSHLLFLDADIYLPVEGLIKIIQEDVDVIGAPCPMKGFDANGNPIYNVTGLIFENKLTGICEAERVGTAVFLLSKKAIESLIEDAKSKGNVYSGNPLTRGDNTKMDHYDVFSVGVVNGNYLSEDFFVCHRLRELGYKVFVDTNVHVRHSGSYTWQG